MAYKSISKKTEEDVEVVPVDADEAVPKVAAKPSVFADHFGVDIGYGAVKSISTYGESSFPSYVVPIPGGLNEVDIPFGGSSIEDALVKKHRSRLSRHRQVSVKHDLKLYKITTPA